MNGDGLSDLVTPGISYPPNGNTPQPGRVFFGLAGGGFTLVPNSVFPWQSLQTVHPRDIVSGDFNGDGRIDLFIANHGYDTSPFPGEQNRLYLSTGGGGWTDATATLPQLLDFTHSATAGDVDGDGDLDLYVGNTFGEQRIGPYLLINDGVGGFARVTNSLPVTGSGSLNLTNGVYTSSQFADLDGDGDQDLVVGSAGGTNTPSRILWNQGGQFSDSAMLRLPAGTLPDVNRIVVDIQAIDISGDGSKDVVFLSTQNSPFYDGWWIDLYQNVGDHNFVNVTSSYLSPSQSVGGIAGVASGRPWLPTLEVLDANRDGALDIVISEYSGVRKPPLDTPAMLLKTADGTYQSVTHEELLSGGLPNGVKPIITSSGLGFIHVFPSSGRLDALLLTAQEPLPALVFGNLPVRGTALRDMLTAAAGGSTLLGLAGDDLLLGGQGNDVIDGGDGVDVAGYGSLFRQTDADRAQVSGPAGADRLLGIESVRFKDGDLSLNENDAWAQVVRIYDTALQRLPDPSGLDFHTGRIASGQTNLLGVATDFLNSPEFQAATGGLNNQQFVRYIYQTALDREPDAGGLAYWTRQLDGGTSRGSMLVLFSESAEHRALTASALDKGYFTTDVNYQNAALLYDTGLGRLPDAGGIVFWGDALKGGQQSIGSMAAAMAGSAEFQTRTAGFSNAQIVDYMYLNTLDRAGDAGGRAYWTAQLDAGLSKADLIQNFAFSAEHRTLLAPFIHDGIAVI